MNYKHNCCGWEWQTTGPEARCPFCKARARTTRHGQEVIYDDTDRLKDAHRHH